MTTKTFSPILLIIGKKTEANYTFLTIHSLKEWFSKLLYIDRIEYVLEYLDRTFNDLRKCFYT